MDTWRWWKSPRASRARRYRVYSLHLTKSHHQTDSSQKENTISHQPRGHTTLLYKACIIRCLSTHHRPGPHCPIHVSLQSSAPPTPCCMLASVTTAAPVLSTAGVTPNPPCVRSRDAWPSRPADPSHQWACTLRLQHSESTRQLIDIHILLLSLTARGPLLRPTSKGLLSPLTRHLCLTSRRQSVPCPFH